MAKGFQTPRGMHDVLPSDEEAWFAVTDKFTTLAREAGFAYIETPVVEDANLFKKKGALGADIVETEMYSLKDRSGNELALRPEGTAPIARAYIEHGMTSLPKPVKLFYAGPMFRYDRPQSGRYRAFHQFGVEVLGDDKPEMDATVIALLWRFMNTLGLRGVRLEINSIGDDVCRPRYLTELADYYKKSNAKLCAACTIRIKENPLRLLDCKEKTCQPVKENAPHMVDFLDRDCHDHFKSVLEFLDELGVPYEPNPHLVRGLDYYNRTTFEFWPESDMSSQALGGGGRYDSLVSLLGGRPTPAVGFAGGVERVINELKNQKIEPKIFRKSEVYVAQLGDKAAKACFKTHNQLLDAGIKTAGCFDKSSIKDQLKKAAELGVPYTLIIGQKEVYDGTVILRDMVSTTQEVYPQEKIADELKKRIKK